MNRGRTLARELALQALYQYDLRGQEAAESARVLLSGAEDEARAYAGTLVSGVRDHDGALTDALKPLVQHWTWERVAAIDRGILRIGAFELTHGVDIPPKVAIDEAIELAKRFSTQSSGAFVNGILDRLYQDKSKATPAAP